MEHSKADLRYLDPETNEKYVPYVIEPSVDADRLFLAVLCDAYDKETFESGDEREVLHLHPALARYRRSDAIGTPYAITVDEDTLENDIVTLRDRDTMEQIKLPISELKNYINEHIKLK